MGVIIKKADDGSVTIENEYGKTFELSEQEARDLRILLQLEDLKVDIHELVEELDGEYISVGSYDGPQEEFEEEVYDHLSGGLEETGEYPSLEYEEEVIMDLAREYGIEYDEDEEDDDEEDE